MQPDVRSVAWVILTLLFGAATGCKQQSDAPSAAPPKYTIGMSQCNLGEPWRVQMDDDIRKAAGAHPEIRMIFKDAQNDALKQRSHVEELVSAAIYFASDTSSFTTGAVLRIDGGMVM